MKVHRFWNKWYDHCWLLMSCFGIYWMLMQKQQRILGAVVDSEMFKGNTIDRYSWPSMKNHDIWSDLSVYENDQNLSSRQLEAKEEVINNIDQDEFQIIRTTNFDDVNNMKQIFTRTLDEKYETKRKSKVLHIFPIPVDGECLSDDGRRTGTCFNAYECRQKGGLAKGDCAMGFGVCCIFIANCNETITNNITYMVSPQFPSFMPNNLTSCSIKIKLASEDISQLRIDFNHFSLGQPNRRTGVCDGDVFNISGGPGGTFSLCGQNSGQHLYYDVGGRSLPRQTLYGSLRPLTLAQIYPNLNTSTTTEQLIEISMNFARRFLPIRLWEIRIAQIPFSQRAPAGCLQYHLGTEGIIQTFNFADNGRHLANQHYRVCMRQEMEMCSIIYQPCDEQSFRIGESMPRRSFMEQNTNSAGSGGGSMGTFINSGNMPAGVSTSSIQTTMSVTPAAVTSDDALVTTASLVATQTNVTLSSTMSTISSTATMRTTAAMSTTSPTTLEPTSSTNSLTTASTTMTTTPTTVAATERTTTTTAATTTTSLSSSTTIATSPLSDDVEGSGDGDSPVTSGASKVSRRPRPVSGGFDIMGFLRSAFDLGIGTRWNSRQIQQHRQERQIFTSCSDRITLPCIIEDFIGTGLGTLPSCEPVHCGTQFCSSGIWPCRIESTVTPFFINIHFGDGAGKGSAEDNIGACLRYTQMQCM